MTVLQELFHGTLCPEALGHEGNCPYARALHAVVLHQQKLLSRLGQEDRQLLDDLSAAQTALNAVVAEEKFIQGFRLGALLVMDVSGGKP